MKRHMDCIGFTITDDMRWSMSELLSELQHLSPSDSFIDATIKKVSEFYYVEISIRYAHGLFATKVKGLNLEQVIQNGSSAILSQIKEWRKNRFGQQEGVKDAA